MRRFKQLLAGRQVTQSVAVRSGTGLRNTAKALVRCCLSPAMQTFEAETRHDECTTPSSTSRTDHGAYHPAQSKNSAWRQTPADAVALSRWLATSQRRSGRVPDSVCRRRRVAGAVCQRQFRSGGDSGAQRRRGARNDQATDPRCAAGSDHSALKRFTDIQSRRCRPTARPSASVPGLPRPAPCRSRRGPAASRC